jgi:hypothetical protein
MHSNNTMVKLSKTYLSEHLEVENFKPVLELPKTKARRIESIKNKYPMNGLEGASLADDHLTVPPLKQDQHTKEHVNFMILQCQSPTKNIQH